MEKVTKSELLRNATKSILFNTEMIQSILPGRKTQTRRVIKPRYKNDEGGFRVVKNTSTGEQLIEKTDEEEMTFDQPRYVSPPYRTGDILYVREKWQAVFETEAMDHEIVNVRNLITNFDDIPKTLVGLSTEWSMRGMKSRNKYYVYGADNIKYADEYSIRWEPSITMPKEAARIFLEVKNVRVERLQHISAKEICEEGICFPTGCPGIAFEKWIEAWNSRFKKSELDRYGWEANPWVWVTEFERIEV
jgi:hypothetical protein